MKLALTFTLVTLILTATALPSHFKVRDCTPSDGVALEGNQFWADNCDLGAGEGGLGQKVKRSLEDLLGKRAGAPPRPPGHAASPDDEEETHEEHHDHDDNWGP